MRTHLAALVVVGIVWGLSTTHATETSSKPEASKLQDLPATVPDPQIATKESPSSPAEALQKGAALDCDGVAPSSSSVTALLSKLVRSSTIARGRQCLISPIPDQSTVQELHP